MRTKDEPGALPCFGPNKDQDYTGTRGGALSLRSAVLALALDQRMISVVIEIVKNKNYCKQCDQHAQRYQYAL